MHQNWASSSERIEVKTALVRDPELMEQTDVVFTNNINDIVHDLRWISGQ